MPVSEPLKPISIEAVKKNPELITQLLLTHSSSNCLVSR